MSERESLFQAHDEDIVRVRVTVEREFVMDARKVLAEPGFEPPPADAAPEEKRRWLKESFFELCGFSRDEDHLDGSYVLNTNEYDDSDFEWPEWLRG